MTPRALLLVATTAAALLPAASAAADAPWQAFSPSDVAGGQSLVTSAGNAVFLPEPYISFRHRAPNGGVVTTVNASGKITARRQLTLKAPMAQTFGGDGLLIYGEKTKAGTPLMIGQAAGGAFATRTLPASAGRVVSLAANAAGDVAAVGGTASTDDSVNSDGPQAHSVWLLRHGQQHFRKVLTFSGKNAAFNASVSVAPAGGLLLAWQPNNGTFSLRIMVRRSTASGVWRAPQALSNYGYGSLGISSATDNRGRATVVWRGGWVGGVSYGCGPLQLASAAAGKPFTAPQTVEPEVENCTAGFAMVQTPSNGALLAWPSTTEDLHAVVKATSVVDGAAQPAQQLSRSDTYDSPGIVNAAVGPNNEAVVTWTTYTRDAGTCLVDSLRRDGADASFGGVEQLSCDYDQKSWYSHGLGFDGKTQRPIATYAGDKGGARVSVRSESGSPTPVPSP